MTKFDPTETELVGRWIIVNGVTQKDAVCERIEWLTSHHLRKVAISKKWGEWEILFQDPDDERYWERTFPQGEMQGGGPPCLKLLNVESAREKYALR